MIRDLLESLAGLEVYGGAFLALLLFVTLLFGIALVFAALTLLFRLRNFMRAKRWTRLEKEWGPVLNEIVAEDRIPQAIWRRVSRRDEDFFITFLMRYARRLTGREVDRVKLVAEPYLDEMLRRRMPRNGVRRAMALRSVAVLGLPKFEDEVKEGLKDPAPLVAMVAARGLAATGDARHVDIILRNMDHFDLWSRNLLMNLLVSMGSEAAGELRSVFGDPDNPATIRTVVADALRQLKDLEAAAMAADIVRETEDRELAAACLRLISSLGDSDHMKEIRPLVNSPDPVIRMAAVGAVAAIGTAPDVSLLVERLNDDSPWVALRAAQGLKEIGATSVLLQLTSAEDARSELAREMLDL